MRLIRPALLALGLLTGVAAANPAVANEGTSPLIGTWTWEPEGTNCTEVYKWNADHTGHVTSGAEITETRFQISDQPDENGFYIFIDKILKDNKGKDCAGSKKDNTGEKTTLYIQLSPHGDQIRICLKPNGEACFGPLTKIPEVEI